MARSAPPPPDAPGAPAVPGAGPPPVGAEGIRFAREPSRPDVLQIHSPIAPEVAADAPRRLAESERFALGAPGLARARLSLSPGSVSLEYSVGPSLAEIMAERAPTVRELAECLDSSSAALAHLHDQGIAHGFVHAETLCPGSRQLVGLGVRALCAPGAGADGATNPSAAFAPRDPATPEGDVLAFVAVLRRVVRVWRSAERGAAIEAAANHLEVWIEATAPGDGSVPTAGSLAELARRLVAGEPDRSPAPAAVEPGPPREVEATAPAPMARVPAPSSPTPGTAVRWAAPAAREVGSPASSPATPRPSARWGVGVALVAGVVLMVGAVLGTFALVHARRTAEASTPAPPANVTVHEEPSASAGASATPPSSPSGTPAPPASSASPWSRPEAPSGSPEALSGLDVAPGRSSPLPVSHTKALLPIDPETPTAGAPNALVTVVLFGDPASPPSLRRLIVLQRIAVALGDVRLAWRSAAADTAGARAARVLAGLRQERGVAAVWRFLAAAARLGGARDDEALAAVVSATGAEASDTERWLTSPDALADVERDRSLAVLFSANEAPVTFVNGARLPSDLGPDRLERRLREERRKAAARVADGLAPDAVYPERVTRNLIHFGEDPRLVTCPRLGHAPWRGSARPLVTVVEFTDFDCVPCAALAPALDSLVRTAGDVRQVHLDLPLSQHAHAALAARFAREVHAARGAEGFFGLATALYAAPGPLDEAALLDAARAAGMDGSGWLAAARRGDRAPDVAECTDEARRLGVRAIPTLYVNGRRLDGVRTAGELQAVVAAERRRATRLVAAGTEPGRVYEVLCGSE